MKPFDFYFSDPSLSLDELSFNEPLMQTESDSTTYTDSDISDLSFFFEASSDFNIGAYYKQQGDVMLAASPFGAFQFKLKNSLDELESQEDQKMVHLKCSLKGGKLASWPVKLTTHWGSQLGTPPSRIWMRATKNEDSSWTPPYRSTHLRLSGHSPLEYCTVLLPSPATHIQALGEGVQMKTDQHRFIIKDPLIAQMILKGDVRWGYPQEQGHFMLTKPVF